MHRRYVALACLTALLVGVLGGTAAANTADAKAPRSAATVAAASVTASAADDNIPGVYLPLTYFLGTLSDPTDIDDVYQVWMEAGDRLTVTLRADAGASWDQDYDIYVFDTMATDVFTDYEVAYSNADGTNETVTFGVTARGLYYIDICCYSGSGGYRVDYVYHPAVPRVHRFYNPRLGTHFYTADEVEKDMVWGRMKDVYVYEGVAYQVQPWPTNPDSLHRFYRPSTGTHFYTADPDEKNRVQSTMGAIYTYEGVGYAVSRGNGGGTYPTIWRFFNRTNGTHFYTADQSERDRVLNTLGHIYSYDGPAFYLAQ